MNKVGIKSLVPGHPELYRSFPGHVTGHLPPGPELVRLVRPMTADQGRSDKYSLNLWRWLRTNANSQAFYTAVHGLPRVFFSKVSLLDGRVCYEFDPTSNLKLGLTYIGCWCDDNLVGSDLGSVLNRGPAAQSGCYINLRPPHLVDITDWFWPGYLRNGRCMWDVEHEDYLADIESRYSTLTASSRRCTWCGQIQRAENVKIVEIRHETRWVPQGARIHERRVCS